jgi:hypothetical protein
VTEPEKTRNLYMVFFREVLITLLMAALALLNFYADDNLVSAVCISGILLSLSMRQPRDRA